jgi:hypothetical protein
MRHETDNKWGRILKDTLFTKTKRQVQASGRLKPDREQRVDRQPAKSVGGAKASVSKSVNAQICAHRQA